MSEPHHTMECIAFGIAHPGAAYPGCPRCEWFEHGGKASKGGVMSEPLSDAELQAISLEHNDCAPVLGKGMCSADRCAVGVLLDEVARLRGELARRDAQAAWTHQVSSFEYAGSTGDASGVQSQTTATPGVATWATSQPTREMGEP